MVTATFRFYAELNDFLPPDRRRRQFTVPCAEAATTKHMIEALGVPHTEAELILVNGAATGFDQRLREGDRVAVYPKFTTIDVTPLLRVRQRPQQIARFIADAHLGGLARLLRMAGFDTLYRNDFRDRELAAIASAEDRILLTRDRELLKHRDIAHGCYVHALQPPLQFTEIARRLGLAGQVRPFSRCLECNAPLQPVAKRAVLDRLPPSVRTQHERFTICAACDRIYWEGSHWKRMQALLAAAMHDTAPGESKVSADRAACVAFSPGTSRSMLLKKGGG